MRHVISTYEQLGSTVIYFSCGPHKKCRDVEVTSRQHAIRCDDCGRGVEFDLTSGPDATKAATTRMSELLCT
jgi:hypothetical protein